MLKNKKNILTICLLIVLLILSFCANCFKLGVGQGVLSFEKFQADSERLIFGEMVQQKLGKDSRKYGLAQIVDLNRNSVENLSGIVDDVVIEPDNYIVSDYESQVGIQGHIFKIMHNKFKVPFWVLKLMCSMLLAICIIGICYCLSVKYGKLIAGICYYTFLVSPWVVSFARNLYWVEFTWFLPILFSLMLSLNGKGKKWIIPAIYASMCIKCLCGYEYISTIMITTISFLVGDIFSAKDRENRIIAIKRVIVVGLVCVLGFVTAFLIHSGLRGDGNILDGMKNVYQKDVLRRTVITTDKDSYSGIWRESMDATVGDTVAKYFEWSTEIILGVDGKYFNFIWIMPLFILLYNAIQRKKGSGMHMVMYVLLFLAPISWLVLAKSHSYIHTHINFVLWYFGFIQICFYVVIKFMVEIIGNLKKKIENGDEKI